MSPAHAGLTLRTLDTHVEGEPARLLLNGADLLEGATPAERREDLLGRQSWLRTALMHEPRGHRDMFGAIVLPPSGPHADVGAVFMEHDGCPVACGHATMGLVTALVERGVLEGFTPGDTVRVETPSGVVDVLVNRREDGALENVTVQFAPTRVEGELSLAGLREGGHPVRVTVVHGATWVLLIPEEDLGVQIATTETATLVSHVQAIRASALQAIADGALDLDAGLTQDALAHLQGSPVAIVGRPERDDCIARTFVGFGEGSVDRSPCGTAVSALATLRATQGDLSEGTWQGVEAVSGGRFEISAIGPDTDGWVRPLVRGRGHVTGSSEFILHEADPFATGFAI